MFSISFSWTISQLSSLLVLMFRDVLLPYLCHILLISFSICTYLSRISSNFIFFYLALTRTILFIYLTLFFLFSGIVPSISLPLMSGRRHSLIPHNLLGFSIHALERLSLAAACFRTLSRGTIFNPDQQDLSFLTHAQPEYERCAS
jgi:hypothetical protein